MVSTDPACDLQPFPNHECILLSHLRRDRSAAGTVEPATGAVQGRS